MVRISPLVAATLVLASTLSTAQSPPRTPVLVELFTSEGCSSCPPADALLAQLLKTQPVPTADILVLEEHVDYWDSLGWRDRFSSASLTQRQRTYGDRLNLPDVYTPQMIVDGTTQFTGNDRSKALRAIAQASHTPKIPLTVSAIAHDTKIIVSTSSTSTAAFPPGDLYAALVETEATTSVQRGENGGRTLHHVWVVRSMQKFARVESLRRQGTLSLDLPKNTDIRNLRVVVFAQRASDGAILAAASDQLRASSHEP
jgi:hypothetical protein